MKLSQPGQQSQENMCVTLALETVHILTLARQQEVAKAFNKVVSLFRQNVAKPSIAPNGEHDDGGSIASIAQDLLILLLPHLSSDDSTALFHDSLSADVLCNKDNGVQKRGYKILAKLYEYGKVSSADAETVLRQLDELSDSLATAAKKVWSLSMALFLNIDPQHV